MDTHRPTARPSAVVLDLGNVVVRWDPAPAVAAGVGEAEAAAFLGADELDFGAWNQAQDGGRTWADALAWIEQHHPRWLEHARAYRQHFGRSLVALVDGTDAVLRDLAAAGVPTYALTNWSAETFPIARERFGDVLDLFADVVVSGEVGLVKPDPRIFALTAERLGREPADLFFADDSATNVTAAREAGWDAVLFTGAEALRADLERRRLLPADDEPSRGSSDDGRHNE